MRGSQTLRVGCQNAGGLAEVRFSFIRHGKNAACFLNQQRAGCEIPGGEQQLKKHVRAPAGQITAIQRGRAYPAQIAAAG